MKHGMIKRSACVLALVTFSPLAASAQGFDNGSFTNLENGAGAPPPPPPASNDGFIDEGSFGPGGTSNDANLAPPPPPPNNQGGVIVPPPPPPPNNNGGAVPPPPPPPNNNGGAVPPPPPPNNNGGGVAPPPPPPPPNNNGGVTPPPPVNNDGPPTQGPQVDPQITAFETRDFGVPPQQELRRDQFHAHTPTSIPGAQLVTTQALLQGMNSGMQMVVIDVLGSGYGLPNAYVAPALASAGSFRDRTQQQADQWLNQITGGNRQIPIVIYCSDPMCWLSYNASLRTVAAGYTNVFWYRGGMQAWEMAGLPLRPTGF